MWRSFARSIGARGTGTPGRVRGRRTRSAPGRMVQRTGRGHQDAPRRRCRPGSAAASASMTTSCAVSTVQRAGRCAAAQQRRPPGRRCRPSRRRRRARPGRAGPAAQAGEVAGLVGVVADQHGLRPVEGHLRRRPGPPGAAPWWPVSRSGSIASVGAALVVAVGRALHDLGVGAERRVVDERSGRRSCPRSMPQLHAVGEGVQAGGRVVAVQPEVEGEVVAGAGRDDQQREVVLGGDARRPGPGFRRRRRRRAGPPRRRPPGAPGRRRRPARGRRAGRPRRPAPGPSRPARTGDLPAAGPRVHDQERVLGRVAPAAPPSCVGTVAEPSAALASAAASPASTTTRTTTQSSRR